MELAAYTVHSLTPNEILLKAWLSQLLSFTGKRAYLDLAGEVMSYMEEKQLDQLPYHELPIEQVTDILKQFDLLPDTLYYFSEMPDQLTLPDPTSAIDPVRQYQIIEDCPDLFDHCQELSLANGSILLLYRFQRNLVDLISENGERLDPEEVETEAWRESDTFESCKISADKQSILLHFLGRMPSWVIFEYAESSFHLIKADYSMFGDTSPTNYHHPDELEKAYQKLLAEQERIRNMPFSVTIGTQEWMTRNLETTHFCNGDPIPEAASKQEWEEAAEKQAPAWCYYDNDPEMGAKFGKLYNWFAVNDPRGLAPEGWHVASLDEWEILADYLGENGNERLKGGDDWQQDHEIANFFDRISKNDDETAENEPIEQKEAENDLSSLFWGTPKPPNKRNKEEANRLNETGFTALPGGGRGRFGNAFFAAYDSAYFWTSTQVEEEEDDAYFVLIYEGDDTLQYGNFTDKKAGYSVRCIKNDV